MRINVPLEKACLAGVSVAILATALAAHKKSYDIGQLYSLEPLEFSLPLPTVKTKTTLGYQFMIRRGDIIYTGYCQHEHCKPEWQVGSNVQYRLDKYAIYLRRTNGKELRLDFVSEERLGMDGTLTTIRRAGK